MERGSATLNKRVTEVERVARIQSVSPATTVEQNPTYHEDLARLEARIEAGFQAFTREVDLSREEVTQSIRCQGSNGKDWTRGKLAHMNTQLRGLRTLQQLLRRLFIRSVLLRRAEPQLRNPVPASFMKLPQAQQQEHQPLLTPLNLLGYLPVAVPTLLSLALFRMMFGQEPFA